MITRSVFVLTVLFGMVYANRFDDLDKQGAFNKSSVYFHVLAYDDSAKLYHQDLIEYIKHNTFDEKIQDSIVMDGIYYKTNKVNAQGLALYLSVPLCWNDKECKDLIWKKRNGKTGRMSVEMLRALSFLMPEKIPVLMKEFRSYPTIQLWRINDLDAMSFYSLYPAIEKNIFDSISSTIWHEQKEWQKNPKYSASIIRSYVNELTGVTDFQKDRNLLTNRALLNMKPVIIQVVLENLIHDEKWERICPEFDSVLKEKLIQPQQTGTTAQWCWMIQKKCGQISKEKFNTLRESFLQPYYADILPDVSFPTPILDKLLHEYAQELLAEQRKKNPVKWRIWPELVGPRK